MTDFCSGHQAKKGEYTSPTGICRLPNAWSTWELRTTAERATLLRALEPCDVTEFYEFALPPLAALQGNMLGTAHSSSALAHATTQNYVD